MDSDDEATLGERIEAIDDELDALASQAERCRKAMLASKWIGAAGCLELAVDAFWPASFGATGFVLGVAAVIGGLVSYGVNRSSRLEASERMRRIGVLRAQLMDQAPLKNASPAANLRLVGGIDSETPPDAYEGREPEN